MAILDKKQRFWPFGLSVLLVFLVGILSPPLVAQQIPSPWYLQDVKTSTITDNNTDILATTQNGTHIFVMCADSFLHLFTYSPAGGNTTSVGFAGKFAINSVVTQDISPGLNWRTTAAFSLQWNNYTNELYTIKLSNPTQARVQINILDSTNFISQYEVRTDMSSVFKNPRVSPLLWHPSLIVGVFYDPSVTGQTGVPGFSMLKYSYVAGSMYNSATSSGSDSSKVFLGYQFYCQNVNNMCQWTSSTGFDEYAMNSFNLVQSKMVTTTPIDYDPSIARNASDGVSYFFHRSVNLAGRPFVLHKKNAAVQELASVTLPYQTNFNDTIPRYVVRIGSKSNVFVGFTTILNSSISYGDYEAVFCHYDSVTMDLRGHVIISTVGKDNFAGVFPQNDNSFVTIGRTNGNLTLPNALSSSPQIFAMQFVPLKVKSFISSVPMQVHPNEVIQLQFESVSTTLGATLPRVVLNGLNSSSVSWASSDTISAEIPGNIIGSGPYDMWVVFDSARYKPSLKIAGITVNYTVSQFSLISVYPASGPTVGFDLVLRTSFVGTIPGPLAITVGGKSCGAPLQLNTTAFQCSVPPGTGKNKLVFISVSSNMSSTESVYVNYDPPIITTISPPTSPTTGGKVIYIFGSGFGPCLVAPAPCDATAENISISIGSVACTLPELKSDGSIACVTPELVGRNLSLRLGVNGQNTSTIYSYDPPSISTVIPPWLSSSNPTIYLEGTSFGPVSANRSMILGRYGTNQSYVCPSLTWISHSSLKCQFTNISLPLDDRFGISLFVEGQVNPDNNVTEFRTGLMNAAPVIFPQQVLANEDESLFIEISSYDGDAGDSIHNFVSSNPQFGSLYQVTAFGTKGNLIDAVFTPVSISHPQSRLLYIPRQNYFGNDSFQVQAIDDKGGKSGIETIQITVNPLPDPPVPQSMEINLDEDTSAVVEFKVIDPDQGSMDNCTVTILALPQSGSLLIANSSLNDSGSSGLIDITTVPFTLPFNVTSATFRPFKDEYGHPYATIHFKANDGELDSVVNGTIILNVRPVNDLPTLNRTSLNLSVFEDTQAKFTFNVTDVDRNDLISFKIHNIRIDGMLFLAAANSEQTGALGEGSEVLGPPFEIVYVPRLDFFTSNASGLQRFNITYADREGGFSEEISFPVLPVNDAPQVTCENPNVIELSTEFVTNVTATTAIRIIANDVDDSELTYHLATFPRKGRLVSHSDSNEGTGGTFFSPDLVYKFNSEGGMFPFINFTAFVRDSHNATSGNCTYILSFKCPAGKANNIFSKNGGPMCVECPDGAVCSVDGSQSVYPKAGWWRSENNATYLPCFPAKACPGDSNLQCLEGYEGTRCGRCSQGYYRFTNGCYKCGEETSTFQTIILVCILVGVGVGSFFVFKISGSKKGPVFGLVSILINFIQTILLLRQMRLNWPDKLLQLLNWLSVINFNVELASPECLAREHSFDFSFKLKLALAIPLIVSVLALMLYGSVRALSTCRKKHMKGESLSALYKGGQFWVQNVRAWMSILNLLFVYIATNALALFDCTVEPDGMSYLDADPSLRCYEPWFYHDLPYGILGICLYVIGIPFQSLVVSLAADRARKNLSKQETLRRFQIFCQKIMDSRHEYKLQYQFISVIQLFQRLVMVFVSIFFTRYSGLQVILTQFILLGNILILFRYQPYEFDILNKFDMLSNLAAMIVLGFGLPFHIDNFNPTLQSALIVFILILICGFIVAAIGAVVLECWKHFVLIKANFSSPSRKESTVSYSAKISGWRK